MTRIEQFQVQRYGHFDDLTVQFGPGCTVVYGENEAGKSTLLDALSDFLWGLIARNHPREFVYKRSQMLLEATVDDGQRHLYTRQGNKLTCDGQPSSGPAWAAGLTREHWDHAYGLNLERLERGGRAVVSGRDDPGGISFLADTGLPIDEVMARIVERQKALFGTHGNTKNSAIRQLLVRLEEIDKRIEELGASAQDVDNLQARLEALKASLGQNSAQRAELAGEIKVAEELLHAHEHVQELARLDERIAELRASGPVLSQEQTQELATALSELADIESNVSALTGTLERNREQLSTLDARPDVLEHSADIRAAVRELEARRADDEVLLDTSAAANHRHDIVNLLDSLGQRNDDLEAARRAVLVPADLHDQLDRQATACDAASTAVIAARAEVSQAQARVQQESVPTTGSETLVAHLARRNEAWQAVRAPWVSGKLPDDAARLALAVRLDAAIDAADAEAERAAEALEQLGVNRGKRQQAEAQLEREQSQLAAAEATEASEKEAWVALVKSAGLTDGLDTAAWRVRSHLLSQLTEAWQKWQEQDARHQSARERLAAFQTRVGQLSLLLTAPTGDALRDVEALDDLLNEAETAETKIRDLQAAIDENDEELAAARAAREHIVTAVAALADGADPADLLERSSTHHQLQAERDNTTRLVAVAAPSIPDLDGVQAALGDQDPASLQARAAELDSQRVALDAAITADDQAVGATQAELSGLQHKEGTAALLAERQEVAARVAELAEQYRNLHVQELILHQYAKLNADRSDTPILDRAGSYLNILTGGRHRGFSIVTTGADKHLRIESVVGDTRHDTEPAKLSDGTEHQVYFALRLAGIAARQEERVRKGEPTVPVVLDDVFQAFDDERSATALQLLSELGREFQIIVMTHERAIYNIAEDMPEVHTIRLTAPRAAVGT